MQSRSSTHRAEIGIEKGFEIGIMNILHNSEDNFSFEGDTDTEGDPERQREQ